MRIWILRVANPILYALIDFKNHILYNLEIFIYHHFL
jgi:hypothetical protein